MGTGIPGWRGAFWIAVIFAATHSTAATIPPNLGNLWDKANGTVVTSSSATADFFVPHATNLANMFTPKVNVARPGEDDSLNTLFAEKQPAGFVHWVEWQTPAPITLRSFKLYTVDDHPSFNRSFDRFTLYAWNGTAFQTIFNNVPNHPYVYDDPATVMLFYRDVPEVTTNRFRAEFVQNGTIITAYMGTTTYGPRVLEIDGFSTVPEPAVGMILLGGMILLAGRSRRQRDDREIA